ncbi:MAG: hypothetical protein ACREDN_01635 [Aestuariivirga sp.]
MAQTTRPDRTESNNTPKLDLPVQQLDTAQYVADMILELRNMAKAAKLFSVMVPLEYAYYEAFSKANRVIVPPEEIERLRLLADAAKEMEIAGVGGLLAEGADAAQGEPDGGR